MPEFEHLEQHTTRISVDGSGRRLYIPKDIAQRFQIEQKTEAQLLVMEENLKLFLVIPTETGFDRDEVQAFAEENGWRIIHEEEDGDYWSVVLEAGQTEVRVDSEARLGASMLHNVFIRGPVFSVRNAKTYNVAYKLAQEKDLSLEIVDEDGIWPRVASSPHSEFSNPPTPEEFEQLLSRLNTVRVYVKKELCSLVETLPSLGRWVESVEGVSQDTAKKAAVKLENPLQD